MIGAPSIHWSAVVQTISIHHVTRVVVKPPKTVQSPELDYNIRQVIIETGDGHTVEIDLYADELENLNG